MLILEENVACGTCRQLWKWTMKECAETLSGKYGGMDHEL
jgi:hypothetical protein